MSFKVFTFLCILLPFSLFAQKHHSQLNHPEVVPKSLINTVKRLTKNDSTDLDKMYQIFGWIYLHKKYDVKGYANLRLKRYPKRKLWHKRKLLCSEYSELFALMCKEANIQCIDVDGYVKNSKHCQGKPFYYESHSWNVAKIDGAYKIIDIIAASGYTVPKTSLIGHIKKTFQLPYIPSNLKFKRKMNIQFLDIHYEDLPNTHMPAIPLWQFSNKPVDIVKFDSPSFLLPNFDSPFSDFHKADAFLNAPSTIQIRQTMEEGFTFNNKNNYQKGIGNLRLAIIGWNSTTNTKLTEQPFQEILKLSKESEQYFNKYLADNEKINRDLKDSLNGKNREVTRLHPRQYPGCNREVKTIKK